MGKSLDNKQRSQDRGAARAEKLESLTLYTLTELEPILGVTHRTLQTYIKEGKLRGIKVGGKWRVSKENLSKFINGEE